MWLPPLLEVCVEEAMSSNLVVEQVRELCVEDVIFEKDSKLVVDSLMSNRVDAT